MPFATASSTPAGPALDAAPVWAQRLQPLLESAGEGLFGIDTAGCCTFVNRAGAAMLGWRTEQVVGRHLHDLLHPADADGRHGPEADCPLFHAFHHGLPCRIDRALLWRADGSTFSAECASHPILDDGVVRGAVVTVVDIDGRRQAEAALHEARVELAQLRDLSAHFETVREDERAGVARDIHDELGSLLVALKMDVEWIAKRVEDRPPLQHKCQGMGRLIATAVDEVARIATELRPSILDHQGIWAALEWQAQEFVETTALEHDLQVHVHAEVRAPGGVQGERWSIAVFRIFQQMLGNVARHAQARAVSIRLYVDAPPDPVLHITVHDDGIGAADAALNHPHAHGLIGMRERAGHFGGTLAVEGTPGSGTRVRLAMPLPKASEDGPSAAPPAAATSPRGTPS